jgi:hypothetical protein
MCDGPKHSNKHQHVDHEKTTERQPEFSFSAVKFALAVDEPN